MSKKYQYFSCAIVIVFIFVLATEVFPRIMNITHLINQYRQQDEIVLEPDKINQKKLDLLAKKKYYASLLLNGAMSNRDGQTILFDFINTKAKRTGTKIESLIPIETDDKGEISELRFKLLCVTDFHRLGYFLNQIESEGMNVKVKNVEINSKPIGSSNIHVSLEGVAHTMSKSMAE